MPNHRRYAGPDQPKRRRLDTTSSDTQTDNNQPNSDAEDEECESYLTQDLSPPDTTQSSWLEKKTDVNRNTVLKHKRSSCPICFNKFIGKVGIPNTCNHNFCVPCLTQWGKIQNTCPIDRQHFYSVLIRESYDAPITSMKSLDKNGKSSVIKPDELEAARLYRYPIEDTNEEYDSLSNSEEGEGDSDDDSGNSILLDDFSIDEDDEDDQTNENENVNSDDQVNGDESNDSTNQSDHSNHSNRSAQTPDLLCEICGSGERAQDILHCSRCETETGYHIYCLNPPLPMVPSGNWLCPLCTGSHMLRRSRRVAALRLQAEENLRNQQNDPTTSIGCIVRPRRIRRQIVHDHHTQGDANNIATARQLAREQRDARAARRSINRP